MTDRTVFSRRQALAIAAGAGAASLIPGLAAHAANGPLLSRPIPKTGEMLPVIGIGTAIIFDIAGEPEKIAERTGVVRTLVDGGGRLIDTAPSYGAAEEVLGGILSATGLRDRVFLATKVRVTDRDDSIAEMKRSLALLKTQKLDLMQLHNVRRPDQDLALLREWKAQGICRYIGITSSFRRDYEAVEAVLRREKPDFFQINYSLADRDAEKRLIPAAHDVGAAVLTNLPFGRGRLFRATRGRKLPAWAAEFDAGSWAQLFLKFLLGNPAVTAVIPGTDKPQYMADNLNAGRGRLPDAAQRKRIVELYESFG
jgi:aryl-alcohol dehydrogenase-like predicted oxidoreductase